MGWRGGVGGTPGKLETGARVAAPGVTCSNGINQVVVERWKGVRAVRACARTVRVVRKRLKVRKPQTLPGKCVVVCRGQQRDNASVERHGVVV